VVKQAELSTEETELLVSLYRKTTDPEVRRFLLGEPRTAIQRARPEKTQAEPDPRLSQRGKALARALPVLRAIALRVSEALQPLPDSSDLKLLWAELGKTARALRGLDKTLGFAGKCASSSGSEEPRETLTSGDCSTRATASRPRPGRPE